MLQIIRCNYLLAHSPKLNSVKDDEEGIMSLDYTEQRMKPTFFYLSHKDHIALKEFALDKNFIEKRCHRWIIIIIVVETLGITFK